MIVDVHHRLYFWLLGTKYGKEIIPFTIPKDRPDRPWEGQIEVSEEVVKMSQIWYDQSNIEEVIKPSLRKEILPLETYAGLSLEAFLDKVMEINV